MTLYVVMYSRWNDWELVGIYSTLEAARDAKRSWTSPLDLPTFVHIFQHELDATVERRGR